MIDTLKKKEKESYTIATKHPLILFVFCADGIRGVPVKQAVCNKPQNPTSVAKQLDISRTAIYSWMKNPKGIMLVSSRLAKKHKEIRNNEFELVEQALRTYML